MICKSSPDLKETHVVRRQPPKAGSDLPTWHALVDFGRDTVSTFCNQEKEDHQLEQLNLWR